MRFLNSISDQLAAMKREMQTLPDELDYIMRRLNRHKWGNLLVRLNEDLNKLLDELSAPRINGAFSLPLILDLRSLSFTPITSEDRARWRDAHKPDVRVIVGRGKVRAMAALAVTGEGEARVSQVIPLSQRQGHIILNWDRYQKLLAEIDKLISSGNGE